MEKTNYRVSVELSALRGAKLGKDANGETVLTIPVAAADLFADNNGRIWLSLNMWAKSTGPDQYGKTHGVKFGLSKVRAESMSAEERKLLPFVGSAKPMEPRQQSAPQPQPQAYMRNTDAPYQDNSRDNDLPF